MRNYLHTILRAITSPAVAKLAIAGAAVAGAMLPDAALAQDLKSMINGVVDQVEAIPTLVAAGSFVTGGGLGAFTLYKLYQNNSEGNQGVTNENMKWAVAGAISAALLSNGAYSAMTQKTIFGDQAGSQATYTRPSVELN